MSYCLLAIFQTKDLTPAPLVGIKKKQKHKKIEKRKTLKNRHDITIVNSQSQIIKKKGGYVNNWVEIKSFA